MAKGATSPAYLWYPKDVFSSGRIDELSAQEECWYRRALDRSWLDNGVPVDPLKCAAHIGKKCTAKAAEKILEMFFVPMKKDMSRMVNPRQEKERTLFNKKRKQKSEAGKRGMAKRWKHKVSGDNSVITEDNIPIPIPTLPTEEIKKELSEAESSKETEPPSRRRAVAKLTRIPEPFPITPEMWAWMAESLPGLEDVNGAHANFVEYWTNAPPGKAEKINWTLTWYKGMRLAKQWQDEDKRNGNNSKRTGPDRRTDAEILRDSAEQIASKYSN